ncbi:Rv0909 family putative TA system antitoxin [Rathayibacter soli]|uniref:Rv0909 family putative TA system antitoxin n=1 Tax=Rathayibacter soli TaxID=3144168 RepID=UPI0027E46902|nr:Rv0909 family putative TA system antitoxin [Glaciibacter superstes]
MAGFDDIAKSVGGFVEENKDKIGEALKSEQAEGISDKILDGAEEAANKVTGDKFKDQIGGARDAADKAVGNE